MLDTRHSSYYTQDSSMVPPLVMAVTATRQAPSSPPLLLWTAGTLPPPADNGRRRRRCQFHNGSTADNSYIMTIPQRAMEEIRPVIGTTTAPKMTREWGMESRREPAAVVVRHDTIMNACAVQYAMTIHARQLYEEGRRIVISRRRSQEVPPLHRNCHCRER